MANTRVGVISCSGEEFLGGTLSRLATRKIIDKMRVGKVVSLCLPLYIAGNEGERDFAKNFPVIAVDGCGKSCAKKATLKYSGAVRDTLVLSELLGEDIALSDIVSAKELTAEHYQMVDMIAEEICKKVDKLLAE